MFGPEVAVRETTTRTRVWRTAKDRLRALGPAGVVSLAFIVLLVILALLGPLLIGRDPAKISHAILQPPSFAAPLGTDHLGRDQLARLLAGIRISLIVGTLAAGMAIVVGITIGAIAGYVGGKIDLLLMRVAEAFQVMPMLVVAVAIVAFVGPGLFNIIAVIALLSWAQTARVTRSEVLRVKHLEFVDAVRCLGYRERDLLVGEIIPNALPAVMPLIALGVADAILQEASISFLGLGSPNMISWGSLLQDGQRFILRAWWMTIFPGIAVFLTVLAFNVFGDAVSHSLNPRRHGGGGRS